MTFQKCCIGVILKMNETLNKTKLLSIQCGIFKIDRFKIIGKNIITHILKVYVSILTNQFEHIFEENMLMQIILQGKLLTILNNAALHNILVI